MFHLPQEVLVVLYAFAPLFSKPVWKHVTTLAIGSILSPGKRTVTSALRITGLREEKRFTNFHRVLNRAKWSSLLWSQIDRHDAHCASALGKTSMGIAVLNCSCAIQSI
jgi:hypothetical protein